MRHKARTSEYQRSFKSPAKDYCTTVHDELFAYRSQRRQLESSHEKIKWDSSDTGSSGTNSSTSSPCPPDQDSDADQHLPQAETAEQGNQTDVNLPNIVQVEQTEDDAEIGEISQKFVSKIAMTERDNAEQEKEWKKPPFVPYGWADNEMETARKLTHNVKADNRYVYPSALKRQKLIKSEKIRQKDARTESRASIAAVLQSRHKAIVNDTWMTEYRRCYSRASTRPASAVDAHKNWRWCQRPSPRSTRVKS